MRLNLTLHNPISGRTDHVVLDAEPETPFAEVAQALGGVQRGALFLRGSPVLTDGRLARSGIRDGDVLTVRRPMGSRTGAQGITTADAFQLAVVGGRLSGRTWSLGPGTMVVGRRGDDVLVVDDPSLSRRHFRLVVDYSSCTVEDLGSKNGTFVDGQPAEVATPVQPGQVIQAGTSLLEIRRSARSDADVHADDPGFLAFNRPARIRPPRPDVSVSMPSRPAERDPIPFPWLQVLAPVALAVVAAVAFRRPEAMLFALMSPVLGVSTYVTNKKRDATRAQRDETRYGAEVKAVQARIDDAARRELEESRHEFPDPVALGAIATGPGRRLWERRAHDLDALLLRVGVGDRPAWRPRRRWATTITIAARGGEAPPAPPVLAAVPAVVDLARAGVLGIAGPVPEARSLTRWLLAQLATLCSPRDLALVVLTNADAGPDWEWVRWLPHARIDDSQAPLAMVGHDRTTREDRAKELLKLLDARTAAAQEQRITTFTPSVIAVFDGIRELRTLPGVPRLLKEGPAVGIFAIGLDTDANRLAEEGKAEIVLDRAKPGLATIGVDDAAPVGEVLVDQVDAAWAEEVARALAPVRDVGGEEEASLIPDTVRLVDLAGIDLERPQDVAERWRLGGRGTEALVGVSIDGPFSLDLKGDGPHGLVAGTTGAGKSEFLQTLVVSLALANRPSAMNFVLVDYKGGSAFADCARLPHTVGLVTNLDGHLTERALVSLDAELRRREYALKDLASPDIDGAWERDPARAEAQGLARLVIVIDEFAELVRELPDFVAGLIRIARVGRSLGVHLILATQRPAGVISPEMRANTGLRVALRMEDKNDSTEVLEAPQAAGISRSTPGRGFVRAGGRSSLVEVQTARVAGRRQDATDDLPPPRVDPAPWSRLGYPPAASRRAAEARSTATDLHALVSIIGAAALELGIPPSPSPWLAPLPSLWRLPPPAEERSSPGRPGPVVLGLEDLPAAQTQRPATFDVVDGGHLLIAGSARSGRSTALRTVAASLAGSLSPSDLHLYGLDFGTAACSRSTTSPIAAASLCAPRRSGSSASSPASATSWPSARSSSPGPDSVTSPSSASGPRWPIGCPTSWC